MDSTAPAWTSLYRANSSGVHASYSVLVHRLTSLLPRFLQTVPHGPALAARLSFPPSRWTGDFHPFKSFNMSGTRLARCGAGLRRIMARPAGRSPRLPPRAGPPSAVTRACTARVQSGGHRPFGASSARRTAAPCLLRVGARAFPLPLILRIKDQEPSCCHTDGVMVRLIRASGPVIIEPIKTGHRK